MISKDDRLLVVCAIDNKVYGLFIKVTQSIDDMAPLYDEYVDLSGLAKKEVVTDNSGNSMLPVGEDGNVCDANNF